MNVALPSEEKPMHEWEGRRQDLDNGRSVFLGADPSGKQDGVVMSFVNSQGEKTAIRLSYEAMDTVTHLYALHLRDRIKAETFTIPVAIEVLKGDQL